MQSNSSPSPPLFPLSPFSFNGDLSDGGFEGTRVLFFASLLFFQGGGMDFSKVGEKLLSSVRSARSLGLLPSTSDRPEVPARAVAAAAVARALAGLPPHQRYSLPSSSEELSSIYGSKPHGQVVEELEEEFYEEVVDAYALIRDVSGLAEKIQSFFMQEVLSVTHSVLKNILQEDLEPSNMQSSSSRLTYSDLCHQIPESKFRQCLLTTLAALFKLMSSYQAVMSFQLADKVMTNQEAVECIRNIKDAKAAAKHLTC